jgi:hypothetical protein
MRTRLAILLATLALVAPAFRAQAATESRVTADDTAGSYLRYDGQTDPTMDGCSTGRRSQNEPSVAVDPNNPLIIAAGANDYCAAIENGDVWAGYYRSTDGGLTWQDSLVPGYPADTSHGGLASPVYGKCGAAGDPTQSFDNDGRLFYGFICFNRVKPVNGSIYVSTYDQDGASYVRTSTVARGTPSGLFGVGLFQDKVNLAVDQSGGENDGNVYVAWARYTASSPNNFIQFSRSTDHGVTFSRALTITHGAKGSKSYADVAVGPDGTIYVTYISYALLNNQVDGIWITQSSDAGDHWSHPVLVSEIDQYDSSQFTGGSGGVDCGDSIFFSCPSGLTFSRFGSNSAVAADETGVHLVWAARSGEGGQAKVYFSNSSNGVTWSDPATIDSVDVGHQWFPDVASADGAITAVFYDSREDPAYSPDLPPGDNPDGTNSGDVVETFAAQSVDGGVTWIETQLTSHGSNFGWETHGSRRVGFWGDYNYISAVPGGLYATWTDSRDLIPGDDPREGHEPDGFDVLQPCTYVPNDIDAPSYTSPTIDDPCLSQGGLDQNIYGTSP